MSDWIGQHFFHPSYVLPWGVALASVPIIVHLINRLRYRRVRFAAMEFLLKSQQRNRRRLMIEQLLLLLLRIAIVAGILLLIARLELDPSTLWAFRGGKSHHVVLLDDSGSMRDRWGETSAFKEGLAIVRRLAAEGAAASRHATMHADPALAARSSLVSQAGRQRCFRRRVGERIRAARMQASVARPGDGRRRGSQVDVARLRRRPTSAHRFRFPRERLARPPGAAGGVPRGREDGRIRSIWRKPSAKPTTTWRLPIWGAKSARPPSACQSVSRRRCTISAARWLRMFVSPFWPTASRCAERRNRAVGSQSRGHARYRRHVQEAGQTHR